MAAGTRNTEFTANDAVNLIPQVFGFVVDRSLYCEVSFVYGSCLCKCLRAKTALGRVPIALDP
jgi:hypothetical protein